jgi:electron transfer flavoprotein alpha subunit
MKIAVCVKFVPVVSRIEFDYENKVIRREGVPSEINPFDLLGINLAVDLKAGAEDTVVALSMGPPNAAEGLTQCYALGADRGILLSDPALAGSDTLATAQALALVLRRESPDLIICGRNSSDAETGQVGPEVAELMGLPHISNVRKLEVDRAGNRIVVERATDEGHQVIECPRPAVVCVTEGAGQERYPGRDEMTEAQERSIEQLTCADLTDDLSRFGLEGSPTWVEDIRLVEPDRLAVVIRDETPEDAARQVAEHLRERLASLAAEAGRNSDDAELPHHDDGDRPIWVVAELSSDGVRQVTLEMLGKARALTPITQSEVVAVVISDSTGETANNVGILRQLVKGGADRVLTLDAAGLGPICGRGVADSLSDAIATAPPYAVLFAATADGRDLAARIAARLRLGLTGDAIDLEINDVGQLVQLKPALGGNVVAPILSKTLPNLVTLRPGVLTPAASEDGARLVRMDAITPSTPDGADVTLISEHVSAEHGALELTSAEVVVGLGMGIGEENVPAAQQLAASIGASICTTRNVVHSGWLPHHIQVGISGRAIAPQVYLAVGIRGAFNHTVGIQKAGVILAINRNHRAAIFRAADYGIVGDWNEFLPPLVEAIRPVLAEHGLA